jgi:hypothetical protein
MVWRYYRIYRRVEKDMSAYTDLALTPVQVNEMEELQMFAATTAAKTAAEKARRKQAARAAMG